jgi:hypothetical protein
MKKAAALVLATLIALPSIGCWGPQKLTRHMDDWTQQTYVDNPWLVGNFFSTIVLHGIFLATGLIDAYINGYYFWFLDAEPVGNGTGTKFEHRPVTPTKK